MALDLSATLKQAHADALSCALADDVHPAFVGVVLTEGTLAASDVLTNLWPADEAAQLELLGAHLGDLWSRAPDPLLAALARLPPGPRAEQLAGLAARAPAEREALTRLAHAALADAAAPLARARALLALARADGRPERVVEAMPLLSGLKIWDLARVVNDFTDMFDGTQRAELRGWATRSTDRAWSGKILLALARVAPPDEARADALLAIARMCDGDVLHSPWLLPPLVPVLSWEGLRRWVDPHLRRALGLWDAWSTVPAWVSLAAPDQLDAMVEMIVRGASYPWDRVCLLALVSRHHPARAEELLARARAGLSPLIGAPGVGGGANPAPVGGGRAATVHQVHALSAVAAASAGEERVALQRQALAHLATDAARYEERETICPYQWSAVGELLDPSLRAACVDVLLAFADRHTCWGAIGGVVACFPADARGLALRALVRVGDGPPAELAGAVRAALDDAPRDDALFPCEPPDGEVDGDWDDADAASLAPFERELQRRVARSGGSDGGWTLRRACAGLTPRAAARALAAARTLAEPATRVEVLAPLIGDSALKDMSELPSAVVDALAAVAEAPDDAWRLADLTTVLLAVMPPADVAWRDRLAATFAGARGQECFWRLAQAFAPALLRTAGPEALALLRALLAEGLPLPARWAAAASAPHELGARDPRAH